MLFCCLQCNVEASCHKHFLIRLLPSTNSATYCYQRWVSPTCRGPAASCWYHLMVAVLTTRNKVRCWSKMAIFSYPPAFNAPVRGGGPSWYIAIKFGMEKLEWAVTSCRVRKGLGGLGPRPFPSSLHPSTGSVPTSYHSMWHYNCLCTVIIISGFGIYGAAVVRDSGVGNTWQRLTLVLHEFLSNGLTPSRLHIVISFLTHADHVFLGLPWSGAWKPQLHDEVDARSGTLYVPVPPKMPSAKNSRDLV